MSVLKLSPAVQQYAWGKVGLDSEVAKLFTSNSGQPVDETTPYAEVCIFNSRFTVYAVYTPDPIHSLRAERASRATR